MLGVELFVSALVGVAVAAFAVAALYIAYMVFAPAISVVTNCILWIAAIAVAAGVFVGVLTYIGIT